MFLDHIKRKNSAYIVLNHCSNYALRNTLVSLSYPNISVSGASIFLNISFGLKKQLPLAYYFKHFKDILDRKFLVGPRALGIRPLLIFFLILNEANILNQLWNLVVYNTLGVLYHTLAI